MQQDSTVENRTRARLRALRLDRQWSLDDLARRSGISASTISRIETGNRRLGLDQLVPLARALGVAVEELLEPDAGDEDVLIRPDTRRIDGATIWTLGPPRDGRTVVKVRYPTARTRPATRTHPGRDWLYVMSGTLWFALDDRDLFVPEGRAADFKTTVPHGFGGRGGPVEVLMIFDSAGERSHVGNAHP